MSSWSVINLLKYSLVYSFLWVVESLIIQFCTKRLGEIINKKNTKMAKLEAIYNFFINKIGDFINYSRKVFITINLGYDHLKDIDILKLIAQNIETEYEEYLKKNVLRHIFIILRFSLFLIISYYVFTATGIKLLIERIISNGVAYNTFNTMFQWQPQTTEKVMDTIFYILLIGLFMLIVFIIYRLQCSIFGRKTHNSVLKKIRNLNERIDSSLIFERSNRAEFGNKSGILGFSNKRSKRYPIADIRTIEKILIDIFKDIRKIIPSDLRPQFIFVLDEMDKIEPHENITVSEKEEESSGNEIDKYYSIETTRERKNTINAILSNLKHFLTTAKAKFIFIANREMYDASLADVSDRNYFIGSIFSQVINVESFYSDYSDRKSGDLTSMTEWYVCQFLFPEWYIIKNSDKDNLFNLNEYNNYLGQNFSKEIKKENLNEIFESDEVKSIFNDYSKLKEYIDDIIIGFDKNSNYLIQIIRTKIEDGFKVNIDSNEKKNKQSKQKIIDYLYKKEEEEYTEKRKREKVILTLRNFITLLAYRSNGAPKKITSIFERYVSRPKETLENNINQFVIGFNSGNLFLNFGYYDQYSFNLISYLVNPVIMLINTKTKDFGDKLLVSSTFLVDHIFKFHKNGFSWRNLELMPEILDINKAPELRKIINRIIEHLSKTHIDKIISGLYQFRFSREISEEINFISKISEREAAAFNFTLDESLSLKRYHKKNILELEVKYSKHMDKPDFIHSLSALHMILGDLHFYDEEYNEAIAEYLEAVQDLRYMDIKEDQIHLFVLYVRNMLKLGLVLEKRKFYELAYITYEKLMSRIISFREIDLHKFGLEEAMSTSYETTNKGLIKKLTNNDVQKKKDTPELTNYDREFGRIKSNKAQFSSDEFIKEKILTSNFTPLKQSVLSKMSTYESIQLIYQPLIAKLQVIEKYNVNGIGINDIVRIIKEYSYIKKMIGTEEKYIVRTEFWIKLANVLFYKNGLLPNYKDNKKIKKLFLSNCNSLKINESDCNKCSEKFLKPVCAKICNRQQNIIDQTIINFPCRACRYYFESLRIICEKLFDIKDSNEKNNTPKVFFNYFNKIAKKLLNEKTCNIFMKTKTGFEELAHTTSFLGNIFLSCSYFKNPKNEFIKIFELVNGFINIANKSTDEMSVNNILKKVIDVTKSLDPPNTYMLSILYNYLSGILYLMIGDHKNYVFQLQKIMQLMKIIISNCIRKEKLREIYAFAIGIKKVIVRNAIHSIYRSHQNVSRVLIERLQKIYMGDIPPNPTGIKDIDIKNISLNDEIKSIIQIMDDILLKIDFKLIDYGLPNNETLMKTYALNKLSISPFSIVNSMEKRIYEIFYKVKLNFNILKKLNLTIKKIYKKDINKYNSEFEKKLKDYNSKLKLDIDNDKDNPVFHFFTNIEFKKELKKHMFKSKSDIKDDENNSFSHNFPNFFVYPVEYLITDSIFCLYQLINQFNMYEISYRTNYSFLASVHEKMGNWCIYYNAYVVYMDKYDENSQRIQKHLEKLIGSENPSTLTPNYHFELAVQYYESAIQVHTEGKAYKHLIKKMDYFNDDYNSELYHFYAAMERYNLNTKQVRDKYEEIRTKVRAATVNSYEAYSSRESVRNGRYKLDTITKN